MFDQDKVERIILNLLSNAVKFSNPSSTISVQLMDKGDTVSIIVKIPASECIRYP